MDKWQDNVGQEAAIAIDHGGPSKKRRRVHAPLVQGGSVQIGNASAAVAPNSTIPVPAAPPPALNDSKKVEMEITHNLMSDAMEFEAWLEDDEDSDPGAPTTIQGMNWIPIDHNTVQLSEPHFVHLSRDQCLIFSVPQNLVNKTSLPDDKVVTIDVVVDMLVPTKAVAAAAVAIRAALPRQSTQKATMPLAVVPSGTAYGLSRLDGQWSSPATGSDDVTPHHVGTSVATAASAMELAMRCSAVLCGGGGKAPTFLINDIGDCDEPVLALYGWWLSKVEEVRWL